MMVILKMLFVGKRENIILVLILLKKYTRLDLSKDDLSKFREQRKKNTQKKPWKFRGVLYQDQVVRITKICFS